MHKMVKRGIPDRWLDYSPVGHCIAGTQIIAFKVPLKLELCRGSLANETEWFTPSILLDSYPNLKTVIDLTNTNRYYDPQKEFGTKGVEHVKIMVEGRGTLPTPAQMQRFFDAMDEHMEKYSNNKDAVIGIHCTHGLNRTGYFVCRYLIERLKMSPEEAINQFNIARGHPIERQHLIENLRQNNSQKIPQRLNKTYEKESTSYISPLSSAYDDNYSGNSSTGSRYERRRGRYHYQVTKADLDRNWRARGNDDCNTAKKVGVSQEDNFDERNNRRTWKDRAEEGEGGRYGFTPRK